MKSGWISVYRKIEEKGWYKKSEYVHLWIHLLLRANHKKKNMFINGQEVTIKPGSFITSRAQLALETKLHPSKIERIIKCFKIEQQIEQQNFNTCRLISIVNYEKYQDSEQQNKHKSNSNRTASEQQANTNNNINKDNNENKEIKKKYIYGEFENVKLTKIEYQKLVDKFGETTAKEKIENISTYLASKGDKYKSHYATILAWDRKDQKEKGGQNDNKGLNEWLKKNGGNNDT